VSPDTIAEENERLNLRVCCGEYLIGDVSESLNTKKLLDSNQVRRARRIFDDAQERYDFGWASNDAF
jgi:hypothetical protein